MSDTAKSNQPRAVLLGVAGAGVVEVARELGRTHPDLSIVSVEQRASDAAGTAVSDVLIDRGEARYEQLIKQAALQALAEPSVVALPPQAPLNPEVAARLEELKSRGGVIIGFTAQLEELIRRTGLNAPRAAGLGPTRRMFANLMKEYETAYEPLVTHKMDTTGQSVTRVSERVFALIPGRAVS
ncbi:shikimate kinase [Gleimia hominis]|uniref:Shikimate kinase n=1 Tax=Gleimia hominis TaxID=595468 RepID=A0ABU3IEK9_9ACTO|nr:shikimate kinase [Gleimia hominis]MDT3767675.1 shikimate kinase [Gleimia hominis]